MSPVLIASTCLVFLLPAESDQTTVLPGMKIDAAVAVPGQLPRDWMTSYEEARRAAARNKVPLLLHFEAKWCGACRRMESEVLHKPEVRKRLGQSLIAVRLDADKYNDLIRKFGISTLPSEVVVQPDGSRGRIMTGAVSLSSYVARLNRLARNDQPAGDAEKSTAAANAEGKNVRSCLIVRHDGKMVGVGGFSPVSLVSRREWKRGSEEFVASFEGVEYFLTSAEEVETFNANPRKYIPEMHGCDLVELHLENRATTGAIEYGSFYKGRFYFFASLQNRNRFKNNPAWYLGAAADADTANDEMFPFLTRDAM